MLYVDTPSGNTYYRSETDKISISGWKMVNVSNTYIRAYLDNKEIDTGSINYAERADVIASITGYGTEEQNPTPGFGIEIETSQLSGGMHEVRIESCYGDEVLETAYITFNYDTEIKSMLYVDTPSGNTYYREDKINISGWKMANISDTYIRAYLDNKEIDTDSINYAERADVIASITGYGTEEQNPTPGFGIEIETSQLSGGMHEVRIESCYRDEVFEIAYITFYFGTSSDFSQLDESKYPGYKEALQNLQEQHPNWIIKIDYTGLDWNAVLDGEFSLTSTGSARSLTQETGAWRADQTTQYEPGWYRASREAIAYMMDPRNSLDDGYVFQFQELATSNGTYSEISNMIQGTYLTKYEERGITTTDSIINTILYSAKEYNISPYHLASRMIHEQGTAGTPLSEGYNYNGIVVYNLFNIRATGSTKEDIWRNGAEYAYNNHWTSPEFCIEGSAEFLSRDYISIGQSTLYYQKYDLIGDLYTHQYMTNIRGANDEGKRISDEYKANGLIDLPFEFTIPVFENMPAEKSPRPSTT